jgi:hypothetical protein
LSLARAGKWLLDSGIQESCGGVARFYRSETGTNKPISTEITGYSASALVYLFHITGNEEYLDRARKTANFLINIAWNKELRIFPFEHPSPTAESEHRAYFFDCGIIIRGLLAVWRHTGDEKLLDVARAAAQSMIADFRAGVEYHPILELPAKQPLARTEQWSRTPGCYQLKAALAWWDLAEATGDRVLRNAYLDMLNTALVTHSDYLPGTTDAHLVDVYQSDVYQTMDRLHPYLYFLEGLLPVLDRAECAKTYFEGIHSVSKILRQIAPLFSRSDVYGQLLRVRIYGAATIGINTEAAEDELHQLMRFHAESGDRRIDGGFFFGRRDGTISPHVNPVSTVFGLQAIAMWREFQGAKKPPCCKMLI